jgi:hypothetical protein
MISKLLLTIAIAFTACAGPSSEFVRAMRYQIWVTEGSLEASHGFGQWIEEFWIPDEGVCFNAVNEGLDDAPIAHAFFATLEERTKPSYGAPMRDVTPVEVQISRLVADQAVAIARQQRDMDARRKTLGREWTEVLKIRSPSELDPDSDR